MKPMDALHSLKVLEPCRRDWAAMPGDDTRRFCKQCQKYVHNLSGMTGDAARRLVENRPDEFCVRFQEDAAGRVMTIDYAPAPKGGRWTTVFIALFSIAASTIGGTVGYVLHRKSAPPAVSPLMTNHLMGVLEPCRTASPKPAPGKPRAYNPAIDRVLTQGKLRG